MTDTATEAKQEATLDENAAALMKQAEDIVLIHGDVLLHVLHMIRRTENAKDVVKLTEAYAMLVARVPVVHRMIANKCNHDHDGPNPNSVQHIDAGQGHYI